MKPHRVIWNISRLCYWDCNFCCVDAYSVSWDESNIKISANELGEGIVKPKNSKEDPFTTAKKILQKTGQELSLEQKLMILNNIDVPAVIDFSGGDPLLVPENLLVMEEAAKILGRDNIVVTATGVGLAKVNLEELARHVGVVGFTYDHSSQNSPSRPDRYNHSNLEAIQRLSGLRVKTSAQLPISQDNLDKETIRKIYINLKSAKIDEIHLMRALPAGRGQIVLHEGPTDAEYMEAAEAFKKMEREYGGPRLAIQTALRDPSPEIRESHARNLFCSSYNITHKGILTISPWAYDQNGQPLNDFVLGDIKENMFSELNKEGLRQEMEARIRK